MKRFSFLWICIDDIVVKPAGGTTLNRILDIFGWVFAVIWQSVLYFLSLKCMILSINGGSVEGVQRMNYVSIYQIVSRHVPGLGFVFMSSINNICGGLYSIKPIPRYTRHDYGGLPTGPQFEPLQNVSPHGLKHVQSNFTKAVKNHHFIRIETWLIIHLTQVRDPCPDL